MTAELIGELTLVNDCLRVNTAYSDVSYLVLWQPEFSLKAENSLIHILNEAGQVVAQVGEEVYLSGGEVRSIDHLDAYVQQQLPSACPGPYWIVGSEVRPNIQSSSELTTVDLVSVAERMVFLIRKQPMLDEWAIDETSLTGQLVLFDRCPEIIPNGHPVNYTPVWPPDYDVQFQEGEIAIVDGLGQMVAQVGEEVRLSGSAIPVDWNLEMYRQLREKLPGECGGPYWVVFEEAEQQTDFSIKTPAPLADSTLLQQVLPRYGRLYYRRDGQVWTGFGAPDDRRLVELPFEAIEAVQVVGETLWLLVDGQFAIADLTSGAIQTVCEAPRSDVSTALLPLPDRQLAVYAARGDDDHTLGWKSSVGICDLQAKQTRPLVERPGWVTLLGLTPDGQALHAVPIGGDGGGPIVIIALDDGTIVETDNFVCLLSFAVAPDRSWFAFAEPEAQLTLYDLTDADLSPMTIALPRQPSRADQLVAGRDGRYFYFTLLPGHSGSEPARTYGWWRADVSTGALEQLSPALPVGPDNERLSPVAVSPDGRALLLRGKTGYSLLDLQSGEHFLLALPPETQILDWRQP